ncbi:MAG: hypothetical protein VST68_01435 [Nitrospirota bacterium]|nr:hypothetical protein [Nitrospirota bacterium]
MDDQTNRGYARLILDLASSDQDDSFQQGLAQGKGATQELSRLLQLAKELGTKINVEPAGKSDQPQSRHSG